MSWLILLLKARICSRIHLSVSAGIIAGLLLFFVLSSSYTQDAARQDTAEVANTEAIVAEDIAEPTPIISLPYTRPFRYQARGRRDPFIPLVSKGTDGDIPSIASLTLTGVIWNRNESLAVLEDKKGLGYPMRVGDRIGNATLVGIKNDAAIFRVVLFGEVHMHTLKLQFKEEM